MQRLRAGVSPELVALSQRGAAAAERTNLEKITVDIVDYHTSPVEAAEIARDGTLLSPPAGSDAVVLENLP